MELDAIGSDVGPLAVNLRVPDGTVACERATREVLQSEAIDGVNRPVAAMWRGPTATPPTTLAKASVVRISVDRMHEVMAMPATAAVRFRCCRRWFRGSWLRLVMIVLDVVMDYERLCCNVLVLAGVPRVLSHLFHDSSCELEEWTPRLAS